jgi:hypothetical protein
MDAAKNHVLGITNSKAQDAKKRSRHRCLARNEGWLKPSSSVAIEEAFGEWF